ncbi:MAG: hypothetical protein Q7S63_01110 [bacterium]|nr:hypothetical protein [bacterium]
MENLLPTLLPIMREVLFLTWEVVKTWWWLVFPFLFYDRARYLWFWWRQERWGATQPMMMLEVRFPREVLKPMKAMENVFSGFWQMHDPPNDRERWFMGQYQLNFSLEIVSTEGKVHFYMRLPRKNRSLFEAAIYSQYAEAEVTEVEDYTKQVPRDIPNKDWNVWGTNYVLEKPDVYPIKTYLQFFEENPDTEEEKRIDPLALLTEGLSQLGPGEHMWVQLILVPVLPEEEHYVERGQKIVDKLVRRQEKVNPSVTGDIKDAGSILLTGKTPGAGAEEPRELIPPEMKLTPGERDIVTAIDQKISKYQFKTVIRFAYVAKRENWFGAARAIPMSFFSQLSTVNLNNLRPFRPTLTKVYTIFTWFLDKRRLYVRQRRLFRYYISRLAPMFPDMVPGRFIMNTEELATIFHLPSEMVVSASGLSRVESKKGQAPSEIPRE